MSKICSNCNINKELNLFYKDKSNSDGYYSSCKVCKNNKVKEYKAKLKETLKETINEKCCSTCEEILSIDSFTKNSTSKDGYNSFCKECRRDNDIKRKSRIIEEQQPFNKSCLICNIVKINTEFRYNHKSTDKRYNICISCQPKNNWTIEKQRESGKKYYYNNLDKMKEKHKRDGKKINRRVRDSLNKRISQSLFSLNLRKSNNTSQYIGCSVDFLKKWFEYLFKDGMNWENYGEWHIDHVKPCSSFNLEDVDEQYICFNWKNLQPLWKEQNLQKNNKIDISYIKTHYEKAYNFEISAQVKEG